MAWIIHIWYLFVICVRFCKTWFVHTWQDAFVYVARYMWNTTSHIWMSRVTHINESCHVSHIWMSHVTRMDASCHMSHIWMRHATHTKLNENSLTYAKSCVGDAIFVIVRLTRIGMALPIKKKKWRVQCGYGVAWPIDMCELTYAYVWRDWHVRVTWHIHIRGIIHSCVLTCLIHTCAMTDAFIRVTWLIRMYDKKWSRVDALLDVCVMLRLCVWRDAFIRVTWIIHVNDMPHSHVWYDSFIRNVWHDLFMWVVYMCDMTHSDEWHDSFICVTGIWSE